MFHSRLIPHYSTTLEPLNNLLKKDTPWKWSRIEEDAFVALKGADTELTNIVALLSHVTSLSFM